MNSSKLEIIVDIAASEKEKLDFKTNKLLYIKVNKQYESKRILIYTLVIFFLIVLVFPIVVSFTKDFYS